jgi:hypothetical protein
MVEAASKKPVPAPPAVPVPPVASAPPIAAPTGNNSPTRTEVRSPTRTEVRSPTSTATDAYTAGNITITGGDGSTTVTIFGRPSPSADPRAKLPEQKNRRSEKMYGKKAVRHG